MERFRRTEMLWMSSSPSINLSAQEVSRGDDPIVCITRTQHEDTVSRKHCSRRQPLVELQAARTVTSTGKCIQRRSSPTSSGYWEAIRILTMHTLPPSRFPGTVPSIAPPKVAGLHQSSYHDTKQWILNNGGISIRGHSRVSWSTEIESQTPTLEST